MDPSRLIYMIEQIARNLEHASDPVRATVDHVNDFWDPRMIAGLLSADRLAFGPVAGEAVRELARVSAPAASSAPKEHHRERSS